MEGTTTSSWHYTSIRDQQLTSRAEAMRERAKIGKGSNRLNYIPKSTGINFPKDWESI